MPQLGLICQVDELTSLVPFLLAAALVLSFVLINELVISLANRFSGISFGAAVVSGQVGTDLVASGPSLSVLSDVARDVCKRKESEYPGLEFLGFTDRVCNWACKLSAFFDLTLRHECLVLIHFAHTFAEDERYAKTMNTNLPLDSGSPFMLMRWHQRNQEPEVTVVDTPAITDRPWRESATWRYTWRDEKVMEDAVALHISRQRGVDIVSATGVITKQSAGGE